MARRGARAEGHQRFRQGEGLRADDGVHGGVPELLAQVDFGGWGPVIENILYLGLPAVEELVFRGEWAGVKKRPAHAGFIPRQ